MKKKRLVWISPHLPYDSVNHAGGKTQNFYLNKLIDEDIYEARLIGFYQPDELSKFTLNQKIHCDLFCYYNQGARKIFRNVLDFNYLKNPWNRYANMTTKFIEIKILSTLRNYKKEGYFPDIIVLQWTQVIFFVKKVKKVFPNAKVIGIEEDVSMLSFERRIKLAKNKIQYYFSKVRYKNIVREEVNALNFCDLVILNNYKDLNLLSKYHIVPEIKMWSAFFEKISIEMDNNREHKDVVFYGAMSRPENYLTAQWLLENVKPLLRNEDIRFVILGGSPHPSLYKYEDATTFITGFVDDVSSYFEKALCLVAPLILGAGIKVKILEALSAGVPVLTNEIGIEGIPAVDGRDFYFCKTPEEYAAKIKDLLSDNGKRKVVSKNAKKLIEESFNYEKGSKEFISWLKELF